jgi:hypothetical protein
MATGKCADAPRYWEDLACAVDADCVPGPFVCDLASQRCVDPVTRQRRYATLLTRTAAALTANFIDYADLECMGGTRDQEWCSTNVDCPGGACQDRGIPTRIALRSFDFVQGVCTRGPNSGKACNIDSDCGGGGKCAAPLATAGSPFDFDPTAGPNNYAPTHVYGLERQPFITEVATYADAAKDIKAKAIELFNPYNVPIATSGTYYLIEIDPAVGLASANVIPLVPVLQPNAGANPMPFSVFGWGESPADLDILAPPAPPNGTRYPLGAKPAFQNGWIIYLVQRLQYAGDAAPTDIVVDQFEVKGPNIAQEGPALTPACDAGTYCIFSLERPANNAALTSGAIVSPWTALVPTTAELAQGVAELGAWNTVAPAIPAHPVELNFANLGSFSRPFNNPPDPAKQEVAFPTTG